MTYEEFTVNSGGAELYCRRFGAGAPLLMIHGAGVDGDFFQETAQYLARAYGVVTYDRRGCGRSGDGEEPHTVSVLAADAAAVLERAGAPCWVAAHSAGTVVALELAAARPELVRGLLLHEPPMMRGFFRDGAYETRLEEISALAQAGRTARAASAFYAMLGEADSRARAQTEEEISHMDRNMDTFLCREFHLLDYQPDYPRLACVPKLVGLGELSREGPGGASARQLAARLECPLVYFPGGHNCAYDLPAEFAAMTIGLLAAVL